MAVALLLGLDQRVERGGLGAAVGLGRHVGGEGDLVGTDEADSRNLGQPVGVLVQDRHRVLAVASVDRGGEVGEAVRRQLHVEVADRPARIPGLGRRGGLVAADPAQRTEDRFRVGGDRLQHPLAVLVEQPLGPLLADVTEGGQVSDLPLAVGRVERQGALGAQLAAVAVVCLPLAADFGPVASVEVADRPDQGEAFARLRLLDLEHGVAVVLVLVDDPDHLDGAAVGSGVGVEKGCCSGHAQRLRP